MRVTAAMMLLFATTILFAQNPKNTRQKSYQRIAYHVTASEAEQYIKWDSIPVQKFYEQPPAAVFTYGLADVDSLPVGHYVLISIEGEDVKAELAVSSKLFAYTINNLHKVQVEVRTKEGEPVTNARVYVNGKSAKYNKEADNFWVQQKKPEEALIKICAAGDTLFTEIEGYDELYKTVWQQRLKNISSTKVYSVVTWLPKQVGTIFKKKYRYNTGRAGAAGFMVFNQPKYKLNDTVRLKAYAVDKRKRRWRKPADVCLEYYKEKNISQVLATLKPESPGSFIYEFVLRDTLTNDLRYTVALKDEKGRYIINNSFTTEDYVLDEAAIYSARSAKDTYYSNDSIVIVVSAKDANGLALLDGTAYLELNVKNINSIYHDSLYVNDSLYTEEKKLLPEGDTKFIIPASLLADADMELDATVVFKNSNNELHEESVSFFYRPGQQEIAIKIINDSVYADYLVNGRSVSATGDAETEGNIELSKHISFPYKTKIDPQVEGYWFYIMEKDSIICSGSAEVEHNYRPAFARNNNRDSIGFTISNPNKIPVNYTIFYGNKIIASGKSSAGLIEWKKKTSRNRIMYKLRYQYVWAGEEKTAQENIGLLYKMLDIGTASKNTVFPGQKDSVHIAVKDFKGRPLSNVNLTAFAYNNQFKETKIPSPPYIAKYKGGKEIIRDRYDYYDAYVTGKYKLGYHQRFRKIFSLDSMQFYKMLFPADGIYDAAFATEALNAQLSVHVVNNGVLQQVYMLYLNRNLLYYHDVTDKMPYSFSAFHGYNQIGIRLQDRYVQIDSIYIQPGYKHDLFIDIAHLPPHSTIKNVNTFLSGEERNLLENSLWRIDNNARTQNGMAWAGTRLVHLKSEKNHVTGPFKQYDYIRFYKPGDFDIDFRFEPGYEYNLTPKIARLEKKTIFPAWQKQIDLPGYKDAKTWMGDTLENTPVISYQKKPEIYRFAYNNLYRLQNSFGKLWLSYKQKFSMNYILLYSLEDTSKHQVFGNDVYGAYHIQSGIYLLLFANKNGETRDGGTIRIAEGKTLCLKFDSLPVVYRNKYADLMQAWMDAKNKPDPLPLAEDKPEKPAFIVETEMPAYLKGTNTICGKVTDAKGRLPIAGATVQLKGTRVAVATNMEGMFCFKNMKEGQYTFVVNSVGYNLNEVTSGGVSDVNISLTQASSALQEVVVTGYGTAKKSLITGAIARVSDDLFLQGKVAGLDMSGVPGAVDIIRIRGISSFNGKSKPLYIIDGIPYDDLPANITQDMMSSMEILKGNEAAMYGARAANGVVLITTGTKTKRTQFRDYAYWQPQLFTDKNGRASFAVQYPDNVTGWQSYILAIDKKLHTGKTSFLTQAYKPVMAQLSIPQFATEGDSIVLNGKTLNYTKEPFLLQTDFTISNGQHAVQNKTLGPVQSENIWMPLRINNTDTLNISFSLQTNTGFKDGEERKLPVVQQGTEETNGMFAILLNDTTFTYNGSSPNASIEIYANNKTLDIFLDEIDHIKKYPWYCMEQTASKLKALMMKDEIDATLRIKTKADKEKDLLLEKLLKAQLFSGGWAWWPNGKPDIHITNYVLQCLLIQREQPLVENAVRNGLLYLQNNLAEMNTATLLESLNTMSKAKHDMQYGNYIRGIVLDTLSLHQQWLYVQLLQNVGGNYTKQLEKLTAQKKSTITGGVYWGEETYRWYNNTSATTVIAYQVLEKDEHYKNILTAIMQYFIGERKKGYWHNTVESATILHTLLPGILKQNNQFTSPAVLHISGDTNFTITTFPYHIKMNAAKSIELQKTGGGLTYFTMYEKYFNANPIAETRNFAIKTVFTQDEKNVPVLQSGKKAEMKITIDAAKEAEYVQIEIPLPAGCIITNKPQQPGMHIEYFKNKAVFFIDWLSAGEHVYSLSLEPRYNGRYILNPSKAALMYFPTFYGRNEIKKIDIR